ncbi:MAG: TVP38/TMEM64 family protein [Gemmatimonadales bacterium]
MDAIVDFIENAGPWTYVLAPVFMTVVAILPIPAEIPAMINGMVFGPALGIAITWGGAVAGALVSFELSRRWGRPLSERLMSPTTIAKADRLVVAASWPGLLFLRLLPAVAFTAVNWGAGLTPIRRWTFFWTTAIGILPGAALFTMSGMGFATFYRHNPGPASGFMGIMLLVVWLTARRLRQRRQLESVLD